MVVFVLLFTLSAIHIIYYIRLTKITHLLLQEYLRLGYAMCCCYVLYRLCRTLAYTTISLALLMKYEFRIMMMILFKMLYKYIIRWIFSLFFFCSLGLGSRVLIHMVFRGPVIKKIFTSYMISQNNRRISRFVIAADLWFSRGRDNLIPMVNNLYSLVLINATFF